MENNRLLCCCAIALAPLAGPWAQAAQAAEPPVITLFNGHNFEGWSFHSPPRANDKWANQWQVGSATLDPQDPARLKLAPLGGPSAELVNTGAYGVNLYTRETFGDCTIRLEFLIPKGSNSGVYVMGEYEVQIKDSYGKPELTYQDLGAVYKVAAPRVNAAHRAGEWQQLLIEFRAPRFQDGKKTANARFVKVVLNGQTLHENLEVKGPTLSSLTGKEASRGPLMLQGDHGPAAYRNVTITRALP